MAILSAFILAVVISIDSLAVGFAYGTSNIKVPLRHVIIIDIICSITVGIALFLGLMMSHYIPTVITQWLSISTLVLMGGYKAIQYFAKRNNKTVPITRQISWSETITLAIALSLDGLAVGVGVSIHDTTLAFCLMVLACSLVTGLVFFIVGHKIGAKTIQKTRFDLSWLSGVVLIILGVIKLF